MANSTIPLNSNHERLEGRINWSSYSLGSQENKSRVYAEIQIRKVNVTQATTGTWSGYLNIDGTEESFSIHDTVFTDWVTFKSFSKDVAHNNDGTGSCSISGRINAPSGTTYAGKYVDGRRYCNT